MATLTLRGLAKTYTGAVDVRALRDATITIEQGEYVVIEGPSGSGKSTMLNQIALLDTPTSGEYLIDQVDTTTLSDVERARLRSATFSFIFQSFHLLDGRSVLDNVALGNLYRGLPIKRRRELALDALQFVGLAHKAEQNAATLSGGERQRVAIARAIASNAPILVADEPTGNLDQANGQQVMDTLEALNAQGTTVILVTHDPAVAARAPRRVRVLDGIVNEATPAEVSAATAETAVGEVLAPTPEGSDSQVRLRDALGDAWRGLWAKPARTVALIASVALGVGLALTTTGLAQTAQYQVSDIFDAQRNQRVSMSFTAEPHTIAGQQAGSIESLERLRKVAGVEDVLLAVHYAQHEISAAPGVPEPGNHANQYDVVGLLDGIIASQILSFDWGSSEQAELHSGEVIIGESVAQEINLGPLAASPAIWVEGRPMRVAAVLTDAGLQLGLMRSVIMLDSDAQEFSVPNFSAVELKVVPGAAPQVAAQAPLAWVPAQPDSIQVNAPPDPTTLRDNIEGNVQTMLLTLTGVALLAAVLSMTNSMTTAVFQRIGEFGLRRAIGARRVHITGLVMSESLAIGILGGIAGIYGSILVILGVTLVRHWQPVLDPVMIPLGLIGGVLVGLVGGLVATRRAARIEPSDALRA